MAAKDEWQNEGQSADDSGVSTIGSSCSLQLQLRSSSGPDSFAEILMNEHNNNISAQMDVVKLLALKSTDNDEEQHSNSSSLESINSLRNHQGSQERENEEDDTGSGSTSCSEDSFEMSSACSVRPNLGLTRDSRETTCDSFDDIHSPAVSNATINDCGFVPCKPSSSYSVDSFISATKKGAYQTPTSFEKIRHRVANQIDHIDTGLPSLDFDKLEKQLATAAQEREEQERRMLGEEVRRRLALQADSHIGPSPQIYTRPHRSNLALRLQTAMNLQVCYMNEMSESETENEESDDSDTDMFVRKSKSAPNLKDSCKPSSRQTQRIKELTGRIQNDEVLSPAYFSRRTDGIFLRHESQRVLQMAKNAAEESLTNYRRGKSKASDVPRQARQYLSKKKLDEIDSIRRLIENAISRKNMELVQLLLERDSLHMEHDSLRVDIDDFTQHEAQASALDLKNLIPLQERLEAGNFTAPRRCERKPAAAPPSSLQPERRMKPTTPVTPLTTPTSPSLSFASVIPNSFNIIPFFKR
ncbi:unnamed protein product [Caenorhabditis auriculariae]|uniref:Schwannomin interacting protein 1 C-terminal domain-containing protein n=1 Tax=Caenorhabditis auriculariae TaxID=2777116 RepID=A0A8S1GQN9_9PELO|nr:unnamed protein product [Caenorhabditis auriculariae]